MKLEKSNAKYPKVSVAMCTYNGERYIREQIDSILSQDYKNITEIVCIDDNSTDSTLDILNSYAAANPVFKIIQNKKNLGFIKNFEYAVSLTTSPLIAISDQDDIWYNNKISELVNSIDNNLMAYSDNEYIDEKGQKMGIRFSDKRNLTKTTSCLNFALTNVISGHTILLNRELLKYALPFPTDIHYDWWLAFCASQHAPIAYVNKPLVGYRQHTSNTIGALGVKKNDNYSSKFDILYDTNIRLHYFSKFISKELTKEKKALAFLAHSYTNKSLSTRLKRVVVFWKHRNELLLFKKRSTLRKAIYCIKVIWKYV